MTDQIEATVGVAGGVVGWVESASPTSTDVGIPTGQTPLSVLAGLGLPSRSSYTAWTTDQYSHKQLASTRVYSVIPSSGTGTSTANYAQTTYGYDPVGRLEWTETPDGTITWNVLNSRGLTTSTWIGTNDSGATPTQPNGGPAPNNNMVDVADYVYDADGDATSTTQHVDSNSADDRTTTYGYDWRDELTSETDANSDTTSYTYDNLGETLTLTDPDNNTTTWSYNSLGQAWQEANPNGTSSYSWYDANGNLIQKRTTTARSRSMRTTASARKLPRSG